MTHSSPQLSVLVADDQADVLEAIRLLLDPAEFTVEAVRSPDAALRALEKRDYDVALVDLNYARDTTSGREGLDLLARLAETEPTMPVVVMTAWGSVGSAVEAMRRGARDYVEKPWDNNRLLATIRAQGALGRSLRRSRALEHENRALRRDPAAGDLIAESAAMRPVLQLMERIGPADANVLVTGEHGTGKELIARHLHATSSRAGRAFVAVNLGGLSEGVFESELFGHVKGAFTDAKIDRVGRFELADGGTLFLDEIANTTMAQQARLLRVLQAGEMERVGSSRTVTVNVRVIAATNVDLRAEVAAGRFREDLLFRLNTIELQLPPLRQRRDDIPLLAMHFLKRHASRYRRPATSFEPAAMEAMLAHPWPGNVRELEHSVERAVLLAPGAQVRAADLALRQESASASQSLDEMPLEAVERVLIQKALQRAHGNVSQAARELGLSRSALYRRMAQHGL